MNNRWSFKEKIARFMWGRNGIDQFGQFLLMVYAALLVVNLFVRIYVITIIEFLLIIYIVYRVFSKNVYKRRNENDIYLKVLKRVKSFFALQKNKIRDRKTHIYRKCPYCKNTLRLQKINGNHTVNCPCCHNRFDIHV